MLTLILMVILFAVFMESGIWFLFLPVALIGMLFRPFGMWHHRPPMGPGFGHGPMGPRW